MIKKGIVIGIVIVFLIGSFASGFTINLKDSVKQSSRRNTLYVGGSGPGNYTKIQDAIDNASYEETVFVYNGTYTNEEIIINKSINLKGEDKNSTIIEELDGKYAVWVEYTEYVNISGFTVITDDLGNDCSSIAFLNCNYSSVTDCISTGLNSGNDGIGTLWNCNYIYVANNTIYDVQWQGIRVGGSNYCIFRGNTINHVVIGNGILLANSNYNTVYENIISNCGLRAIRVKTSSTNNLIYHNNIIGETCSDESPPNYWDDGYPSGGNYWSLYSGNDNYHGPNQNISGCDGIGDTSYGNDNYPLMYTWYPTHPDIIYIDDDYDISTPGFGYDRFNRIQYGINVVPEGGIVYVYNGTYFENIIVNKSVNLYGEDKITTIIDGNDNGDVVQINSCVINISNFTVKNGGPDALDGAGFRLTSAENNNISNVDCVYNEKGIILYNSSNISISNTKCNNNEDYGIIIREFSRNNSLINNACDTNAYGIGLYWSDGNNILINNNISNSQLTGLSIESTDNNVIIDCIFNYNQRDISMAYSDNNFLSNNQLFSITTKFNLRLGQCDDNILLNNTIENGDYGIWLGNSNYNTLLKNNLNNNGLAGIFLESSIENIIQNNTITNSSIDGIKISVSSDSNAIKYNNISQNQNGIHIENSNLNTVSYNNASFNYDDGIDLDYSSNNSIFNNRIMENDGAGISFSHDNINNEFFNNYIISNVWYGLDFSNPDNNGNKIYHNNLVDNNAGNARDLSLNIWDNGYPSGGNYWDDYTGNDTDSDGIGDTSYNISGGSNKDNYPLIKPMGENPPVANFTHSGNESPVLFDGSLSYDRDGIIVNWTWGFGDGTTGYGILVNHSYSATGIFNVMLTVIDDDGYTDNIIKIIEIEGINQPPGIPFINGPKFGKPGTLYPYTLISVDPEDEDVFYEIDWGDGSTEPWDGPYESNTLVNKAHEWEERGIYIIRARAKDDHGTIGEWGTLLVTMPRNHAINTPFLHFIQKLFETHPNLFPLLQLMLQRLGL